MAQNYFQGLLEKLKQDSTGQSSLTSGLLGNPDALIGFGLLQGATQGKNVFEAALPAITQAAQINKAFQTTLPKTKEVYDTKTGTNVFRTEAQLRLEPDRYTGKPFEPIGSKVKRSQENTLFGNYTKDKGVQGFNQSSTQLQKMLKSFEEGTGAGDVAGVFAFMKTLDPNSVVRESEFEVAEGTGGAKLGSFKKAWQTWKKLNTGERLTDREKDNFKRAAIGFYEGELSSLDNLRGSYSGIIKNQNLDPKNVFVDNDLRPKNIILNNKKIRTPAGATLADYKDGVYYWKIPGIKGFYKADSRGRSK
jgi:hypothetical protein